MKPLNSLWRAALVLPLLAGFALAEEKPPDKKAEPRKAGLSGSEQALADKIVIRFFKERDREARRKILEEPEPYDRIAKSDVGHFVPLCFKWSRFGPLHDGKSPGTCTDPKFPGKYIIENFKNAVNAPTGVFISLHGGGPGEGQAEQIRGLFGTPAPNLICVYPTVIQTDNDAWNTEREEQYVLAVLDDLKRTYRVDTNRVYLAGHSMGGFGAWSIGGRHADLFAAATSMAGAAYQPGVVPNFRNLPIWFHHSKDDQPVPAEYDIKAAAELDKLKGVHGGYEFVFKLDENNGHKPPPGGVKPIFEWMQKHTRNPYPDRIVWEPSRPYKRFFYWLKHENPPGSFVVAKREKNVFTVEGGAAGLWIYFNEKMVKHAEGAGVVVKDGDRETFNGPVPYSLVALVESIGEKNDPEMYFTGRVKVK